MASQTIFPFSARVWTGTGPKKINRSLIPGILDTQLTVAPALSSKASVAAGRVTYQANALDGMSVQSAQQMVALVEGLRQFSELQTGWTTSMLTPKLVPQLLHFNPGVAMTVTTR